MLYSNYKSTFRASLLHFYTNCDIFKATGWCQQFSSFSQLSSFWDEAFTRMLLIWCECCISFVNSIYLSSFRVRFTVFHSIFHFSSLQLNSDHVVFSLRTKLRNICVQLVAAWISFQRETRNLIMQLNSRLLMQEHFSNRFTSCIHSSDRQHKANTHPSTIWLENPVLFYEQKQYFVCFTRGNISTEPHVAEFKKPLGREAETMVKMLSFEKRACHPTLQ